MLALAGSARKRRSAGSRRRRCRRAASRAQTGTPSGQGEIGHLAVHGRRTQRLRHLRSEAGARQTSRAAPKEAISTFFGNPGPLMKSPFTFKQYGQYGRMGIGYPAAHCAACG